jgi:hypothetical protein
MDVRRVMARRWKTTPAEDVGPSLEERPTTLRPGTQGNGITVVGSHAVAPTSSRPKADTSHGNGLQASTLREAKYMETLYEEWVQGDPNHTAALFLLGMTLLVVAYWHHISYWLAKLFTPSLETIFGLASFICFFSALYPWVAPVQDHLLARKSGVKAKMEVRTAILSVLLVFETLFGFLNVRRTLCS